MIVKINLFAAAKDIIGSNHVEIVLEDSATIGDLKQTIVEQYPEMTDLIEKSTFSIDKEYAEDLKLLYHGIEIGLIPPVSGG